jgi:D-alanyl-D-alanine carboxypeptidase
MAPDYPVRIAEIARSLGIPANYASARGLSLQPEAEELKSIGPDDLGRDCRLAPAAAQAWRIMQKQARTSGVELTPLSGFRSVERQTEIVRGKLALGEPIDEVLKSIAAPGYSEHHTGRAIDIGTPGVLPLEEVFANTAAFAWLMRHAQHFGFHLSFPKDNRHGFVYEPWHWCWSDAKPTQGKKNSESGD